MRMVFTLLGLCILGKGVAEQTLTGVVGGKVTFHCKATKNFPIESIKFQGGINYENLMIESHISKNTSAPKRTSISLNPSEKSVRMSNLTPSDEGKYKCFLKYDVENTVTTEETEILLMITANHSAPTLERDKTSNGSLTCTAVGIYPLSNISWNPSGDLEHRVKDRVTKDKDSLLYNISSTAFFNCLNRSSQAISCSVGGVSSEEMTVCEKQKGFKGEPNKDNTMTIIIVVIVLLLGCLTGIYLYKRMNREQAQSEGNNMEMSTVQRPNENPSTENVETAPDSPLLLPNDRELAEQPLAQTHNQESVTPR